MKIRARDLHVARVLHEDGDFATLEVGKTDEVTFHLGMNDEGETVGGDQFLTVLFVRRATVGDGMEVWDPWA